MTALRTRKLVALFVDRSCQQWIVRDPEGNFWILPSVEDPWDQSPTVLPDCRDGS